MTATGNYSTNIEETQKQIFGSFMLGAWWNNDYTVLLEWARKQYLLDRFIQMREQKSEDAIKEIYNNMKLHNHELPVYSIKQRAFEDINEMINKIKVNESEIRINIETPN